MRGGVNIKAHLLGLIDRPNAFLSVGKSNQWQIFHRSRAATPERFLSVCREKMRDFKLSGCQVISVFKTSPAQIPKAKDDLIALIICKALLFPLSALCLGNVLVLLAKMGSCEGRSHFSPPLHRSTTADRARFIPV
jgi:hypothetical protein